MGKSIQRRPVEERDSWIPVVSDSIKLAEYIASGVTIPKAIQGKPKDVLTVILTGRDVGLPPMQALRSINVIEGRPALSSEAMAALAQRAGHQIRVVAYSSTKASVKGRRAEDKDDPDAWLTVTYTREDAAQAGLWGKKTVKFVDGKRVEVPGPWVLHPADMLMARARSRLARLLFPDVLMGLPTEVELEDGTEVGSAPVQPVTVAAPSHLARMIPDDGDVVDADVVDDQPVDGEAAVVTPAATEARGGLTADGTPRRRRERPARPQRPSTASEPPASPPSGGDPTMITTGQIRRLNAGLTALGIGKDRQACHAYAARVLGHDIASSKDLTVAEAARVIASVEADVAAQTAAPPDGDEFAPDDVDPETDQIVVPPDTERQAGGTTGGQAAQPPGRGEAGPAV